VSALKDRIVKRIQADGPITVAEYMALCLLDPVDGYYPTRDPLGSDGDFITAPEISQMFGEVLGLWAIQSWKDMGEPAQVNLVELGPGRGVMMADILRTARLEPNFFAALSVTLIEASAALEAVQAQNLAACGADVQWVPDISKLPPGPAIIIGNEFLDCLPIRQFVQKDRFAGRAGWRERLVTLEDSAGSNDKGGDNQPLAFGLSPTPISAVLQAHLPEGQSEARNDDLLEINPACAQILDRLHAHFSQHKGRALFIDYGPEMTEFGDTLQALKRHKKLGVFDEPGDSDLTARVDFAALTEIADKIALKSLGPVSQRAFLSKLGIEMRAVALIRTHAEAKPKIARQLHRLMDEMEMGALFKAICFGSDDMESALGF